MSDDEQAVRAKYGHAAAVQNHDPRAWHRWTIRAGERNLWELGGGPTEAEAWKDARQHLDREEPWREVPASPRANP